MVLGGFRSFHVLETTFLRQSQGWSFLSGRVLDQSQKNSFLAVI